MIYQASQDDYLEMEGGKKLAEVTDADIVTDVPVSSPYPLPCWLEVILPLLLGIFIPTCTGRWSENGEAIQWIKN